MSDSAVANVSSSKGRGCTASIKAIAIRVGTLPVSPHAVAIAVGGRRKYAIKSIIRGASSVIQESSFDHGLQKLSGDKNINERECNPFGGCRNLLTGFSFSVGSPKNKAFRVGDGIRRNVIL